MRDTQFLAELRSHFVEAGSEAERSCRNRLLTGRYTVINGYLEADGNELPTYFHPYRLTPLRKFVKGTVWKFPKRRKVQPDNEGPQDIVEDYSTREPFFAVCKHCAELLHKR